MTGLPFCRLVLAALAIACCAGFASTAVCQDTNEQLMARVDDEDTEVRMTAIRSLSMLIMRQLVSPAEREVILGKLKEVAGDPNAVVRMTSNVELLKIAAAENNVQLAELAMQAIRDANINVRRGMIKFFRSFYGGRYQAGQLFESRIRGLLTDPDLEIRFHSAATLFSWGLAEDPIIDILLDSLDFGNYRAAIVYALVQSRRNRAIILAKLLQRLEQSEHNAGIHINLISLLMPESVTAVKQLLPFYQSTDVAARAAVVDALGRMRNEKEDSIALLVGAVEDPSSVVRRIVLPSLVRLEPESEVLTQSLFRLLRDGDPQVAMAASDAFSYFDGRFDEILPPLVEIFRGDEVQTISAALDGCMTSGPLAQAAAPEILGLLKRADPEIQMRAAWALYEVGADKTAVVSALQELLAANPDEQVFSTALEILSLYKPTDDASRRLFVEHLHDDNLMTRFSCVQGLRQFASPELVEDLLSVEGRPTSRLPNQLLELDNEVVKTLVACGDAGAEIAARHLEDEDPIVRSRAIETVNSSGIVDDAIRRRILAGLQASEPIVQLSAAKAVSTFDEIDDDTLQQLFEVTSPTNRHQTVTILKLLAQMGAHASAITPQIAELMNGGYRNRFANDAMNCLTELGQNAAPAVEELLKGDLSLPKLNCLAAIGPPAQDAVDRLNSLIDQLTEKIRTERSIPALRIHRRKRISAALALGSITGQAGRTSDILREELGTDARPNALNAIGRFVGVDQSLVNDVVSLLPDKAAINALAAIGAPAAAATEKLQEIANSDDSELAYLATRALWQIQDDPELAVETVKTILHDNRFEAAEIRLEDRQKLWETLRYLASRRESSVDARQILQMVETGRFPNLRAFVQQLPTGSP